MNKSIKNDILFYAKEKFGAQPEYLWRNSPTDAVLRHTDNAKWYAVIMDIPRERLGLSGNEKVDILNVKCEPLMVGALLANNGYFPAYHMNKEHWITILLDGTVAKNEIYKLLDISFELTK